MHSPFPGVDPFLERRWKPFHSTFISFATAALNPLLPADLFAETETDIYIHELSAEERGLERRRRRLRGGMGTWSS